MSSETIAGPTGDAKPRKPISKGTRFRIFDRDGFTCAYCGRTPPAVVLHVDHVIAVADGGDNDESNLVTSCADCNLAKGPRPLGSQPPVDYGLRSADLQERADQIEAYRGHLARYREQVDKLVDLVGNAFWGLGFTWNPEKSTKERRQVARFIDLIGVEATCDAADLAFAKFGDGRFSQWKYFCGICWNRAPKKPQQPEKSASPEYEDCQPEIAKEIDGMELTSAELQNISALLYAVLESQAHPEGSLRKVRMQYVARHLERISAQDELGHWGMDCIRAHTGGW